jgi:hypothetical protein
VPEASDAVAETSLEFAESSLEFDESSLDFAEMSVDVPEATFDIQVTSADFALGLDTLEQQLVLDPLLLWEEAIGMNLQLYKINPN